MSELTPELAQEAYDRYYIGESRALEWVVEQYGWDADQLVGKWLILGYRIRNPAETRRAKGTVGKPWQWTVIVQKIEKYIPKELVAISSPGRDCVACGREREFPAMYMHLCSECAEDDPGRQIANLRQERGISQKKLAQAIGCATSTISCIERGSFGGSPFIPLALEALGERVEMTAAQVEPELATHCDDQIETESRYSMLMAFIEALPKDGRWTKSKRDRYMAAYSATVDFLTEVKG